MSAAHSSFEQVYNAHEQPGLLAAVDTVVLVLMRRGMMAAGFDALGQVLTIHYRGYNKNRQVWDVAFYEQLMTQHPLLASREKIKATFFLTDAFLAVPDELFDPTHAENWLRQLFFVEITDVVLQFPFANRNVHYLAALPVHITELIHINFPKSIRLPLPWYQFTNRFDSGTVLQVSLTPEVCCALLEKNDKILWHQLIPYTIAEDLAHAVLQVAAEHAIPAETIEVLATAADAATFQVLNELSRYFPGLKGGDGRRFIQSWDGALQLARQLYTCVS